MARNTEFQFVSTDTDSIISALTGKYEALTGTTVQPASPEQLFIRWVANILVQERVQMNYAANQNLPSRAEGPNLDALGELFYNVPRPDSQAATAMVRFNISEAQSMTILIPEGTRVTDISSTLFWATKEDAYIPAGSTYADVEVQCMTTGTVGNDYAIGQINTLVDTSAFPYYSSCSNITVSGNGSDAADDDTYYELMMASMDSYSTAGSRGSYLYHAKACNTEIGDVAATKPSDGCVNLYVLMKDGTLANSTVKAAVLEACSADTVRPLTDYVQVVDAAQVNYSVTFTYYYYSTTATSATEIAAAVEAAVEEYVEWQSAKIGRDINPDKLRNLVLAVDGVKRVTVTSPQFTQLRDGSNNDTPQVAKLSGTPSITNGGPEDE